MLPTEPIFTPGRDKPLIDISNAWQPKPNYLKRAKSGQKRWWGVVKEIITDSLFIPCSSPPPPPHPLTSFTFLSSQPSEFLEKAINHTCLATIRVVASCENLFQKVERGSTFCNKICKMSCVMSSVMCEDRFDVFCLLKMAKKCTSYLDYTLVHFLSGEHLLVVAL